MKIGDEVKTTRGWTKVRIGSTRLRPFSDARKNFALLLGHVKDDEPCMWEIVAKFPPKEKSKA